MNDLLGMADCAFQPPLQAHTTPTNVVYPLMKASERQDRKARSKSFEENQDGQKWRMGDKWKRMLLCDLCFFFNILLGWEDVG